MLLATSSARASKIPIPHSSLSPVTRHTMAKDPWARSAGCVGRSPTRSLCGQARDGIDPDAIPRLFERTNDKSQPGIGLPPARQLAEAHLGSLGLVTHQPPVLRLRGPGPDAG
jgi:hypothetical protein